MDQELSYPDEFADRLELIWGAGFLSPGGADEVRQILRGIDLRARTVLEIGCGIGGPAIVMAGELHAHKVVGIDIEPQLIDRAGRNAKAAGLQDRVEFQLVEPGALPFEDSSFDVVFSKDAIVHIEDKLALYREVLRVLKPGGRFVAGDWFASPDADELPEFRRYRDLSHLTFAMQTAEQAGATMREAGFSDSFAGRPQRMVCGLRPEPDRADRRPAARPLAGGLRCGELRADAEGQLRQCRGRGLRRIAAHAYSCIKAVNSCRLTREATTNTCRRAVSPGEWYSRLSRMDLNAGPIRSEYAG